MNCDEAELALENQALGILTQADRQSLEDHLLTCEACRAIRPLDLKIQAALGALEDEATRDVDWARLERLTRNWRSDYRGRWWVGLLVTAGQAPLATLAFTRRGWGEWLLLLVLAALVTAWVVRAQIDRRWTAAAQLADSRESLRAFWQRLATVEANGLELAAARLGGALDHVGYARRRRHRSKLTDVVGLQGLAHRRMLRSLAVLAPPCCAANRGAS